jgi:hypothetical protein
MPLVLMRAMTNALALQVLAKAYVVLICKLTKALC